MERDICPNCGKKTLERMEVDPEFEWLSIPGYEDWGCLKCGQTFFKKIEIGVDRPPRM